MLDEKGISKLVILLLPISIVIIASISIFFELNYTNYDPTKVYQVLQETSSLPSKSPDPTNEFLSKITKSYPSYEILEYAVGDADSSNIQLAAIAKNTDIPNESVVFIVDEYGVGKIGLAVESVTSYRHEDSLQISKDTVQVSLNIYVNPEIPVTDKTPNDGFLNYNEYKIYDFSIIVTREDSAGVLYTLEEDIRADTTEDEGTVHAS